ncbi:MAG: DUF5666 domain-containing protein, partial [Polaromonas sp.]|nr:DUF5666 domain-containing protein [Polaromonas sp.]
DDGNKSTRDQLKLGMMVRVKGKAISRTVNTALAEADEISFGSELLGPIDSSPSSQTAPATLVVLGQTVQITASTIFEDGLTLSALAVNDIVEVHGFADPATNRLVATRIERKLLANVTAFKLQGTVSALDPTAKIFKIGTTLTISYAGVATADLPANLADDLLVRVRLATTPTTGTRTATRIRAVEMEVEDRGEAEVEGMITDFTSSARFSVNGQPVDASGATVPAGLKLGSRVEVEGSLVKGVLVAKEVQLKDENETREFELHGIVSNKTSTLPGTFTFTLTSAGGIVAKVTFTIDAVVFDNGMTAASLLDGIKLEVKGVALPDGTIQATRISLE